MVKRLGMVTATVEIAALALLWLLLSQPGMPPRTGVLLVFGLPISFGLHIFEEFFFPGGGAEWFRTTRPQFAQHYTDAYFFRVNVIPLVLALLVTLGTFDFAGGFTFFGIRAWLGFVCFQAIHIVVYHAAGMVGFRRYSPGIVTSVLLYAPLVVLAFVYLLRSGVVDGVSAIVAVGIGYAVFWALERVKAVSREQMSRE